MTKEKISLGDPDLDQTLRDAGVEVTLQQGKRSRRPVLRVTFPRTQDLESVCKGCNGVCDISFGNSPYRETGGVEIEIRNQREINMAEECPIFNYFKLPKEELPDGCPYKGEINPDLPYLAYQPEDLDVVNRVVSFVHERFRSNGLRKKVINPSLARVRAALM